MSTQIPLRYANPLRRPYIEVDGPALRLRLPRLFDEVWNLNIADVAVVVVADQSTSPDDTGNGWVFEVPVSIPYAATERPTAAPNLLLLFKTPQRLPPLRAAGAEAIGWSSFGTQFPGVLIDGLELRAHDAKAAVLILASAGLESVDRPNLWLRHHRRVTQDPYSVQAAQVTDRDSANGTVSGSQITAAGLTVSSGGKRGPVLLTLLVIGLAVGGKLLLPWAISMVTENGYSATPFTAADKSFSVTLPAEGKLKAQTRPFAGAVANAAIAESRDGDAIIEQLILDPDVAADYDGDAAMRDKVDQFAKDSGGTVSDYQVVPFGRYTGVEATVKDGQKVPERTYFRMVYTGKSVIALTCDPSVYRRTVSSLRIPSSEVRKTKASPR